MDTFGLAVVLLFFAVFMAILLMTAPFWLVLIGLAGSATTMFN